MLSLANFLARSMDKLPLFAGTWLTYIMPGRYQHTIQVHDSAQNILGERLRMP